MATDERDLREELNALARKKERILTERRKSPIRRAHAEDEVGEIAKSESLYSRMQSKLGDSPLASPRRGSGGSERMTKRQVDRGNDRLWGPGKFDTDGSGKRLRMQSAVTIPEPSPREARERQREVRVDKPRPPPQQDMAASEREKRRAVAPYSQKDGLARSRRMFGALMGHLGKAKAMIEKDSTLIKRQTSKLREAEQKEKEQNKTLELNAKHVAMVTKLENLIATAEVDMKEAVTRKKLQQVMEARKGAYQSRFILTVASPPIYYLPKKPTKETEDLVAASMEAYEEKARARARDHDNELREIEAQYTTKIDRFRRELEKENEQFAAEEEKLRNEDHEVDGIADPQDVAINGDANGDESMQDDTTTAHDDSPEPMEKDSTAVSPPRPGLPSAEPAELVTPRVVKQESPVTASIAVAPVRAAKQKRAASPHESPASSKRAKPNSVESMPNGDVASVKEEIATSPTPSAAEEPAPAPAEAAEPAPDTVSYSEPTVAPPSETGMSQADAAFTTPQKPRLDVGKLKVTDLREQLKKRGLDTKGLKKALVKRLEDALGEVADQ